MPLPIRKTFAALLCTTAAVPCAMVLAHGSDPELVFRTAQTGGYLIAQTAWFGGGFFLVTLLVYPPFLPLLKLRFGEIKRRLSTDRGPMKEAVARLRHLETHVDRLALGKMARELGDHKTAFENLTRAHEMEPNHVATRFQLGLALVEVNRYAEAAKFLESVVAVEEKHAYGDALFYLGRSLFRLHRDSDALAHLHCHQQFFPGHRQTHLLVARVLADMGRIDEAKEQVAQASRPVPDGKRLTPAENLARTRAKVTFLRKGKAQ